MFTNTQLSEDAIQRLVKVYKTAAIEMIATFESATDFGRNNRLALLAQIDNQLKQLGIDTQDWLDTQIPLAYKDGMKAALAQIEKQQLTTPFYHGTGGRTVAAGNNMFGSGFYISQDKKIAEVFGPNVQKVYLNIFDSSEILHITNQQEYTKFITNALNEFPGMDAKQAMPKYAEKMGYKAILGSSEFDELAGMNVLSKSYLLDKPALPVKTLFTQPNKAQVKALIDDASKAFGESLSTVGRTVTNITAKAFQQETRARIAAGTLESETRKAIVARVKDQLKNEGLTALVDKGGRQWSVDRYADMLVRTKLTEARNTGLANKMLENNQDLVQVSINGSDHQACADWEGKVLSISGNTPGYDTVDDAEADGLFHPNCKHTINPIEPDLARQTYGWDVDKQDYDNAIYDDMPKPRRPESAKQSAIEDLLNKRDVKGAAEVIKTIEDPELKNGLESMLKYYDK